MADLPLMVKIALAPAVALVMLAIMAVGTVIAQRNASAELRNVVQVEMRRSMEMKNISERITDAHGRLYLLLTHQAGKIDTKKIDGQTKALLSDLGAIESELKTVRELAPNSRKALFAKLIKQLDETRSAVDLVGSMMSADFEAAASFIAPFEQSYQQMVDTLGRAVKATQDLTDAQAAASESRAETTQIVVMLAALVTLVLVGAIAFATVLGTRSDVRGIATATETLAGGNNDINLAALARKDELGAIVQSLTIFRDNQVRLIELRKEQEAAREATAREQALIVSSLAAGLDHLASGNLTFRLEGEFPGEYRKLGEDFNAAIARLEETLRVIWQVTAGIQSGLARYDPQPTIFRAAPSIRQRRSNKPRRRSTKSPSRSKRRRKVPCRRAKLLQPQRMMRCARAISSTRRSPPCTISPRRRARSARSSALSTKSRSRPTCLPSMRASKPRARAMPARASRLSRAKCALSRIVLRKRRKKSRR